MKKELIAGFVGNPNSGKTTLFNTFTGANLKVANWPGVSVERIEGIFRYQGEKLKLVDLPGIYSLASYTMEEKLTREFILESNVDVIVNVVDASCLERNLYLTLQLVRLGKPVIIALNMMDIVEARGMKIDLDRLSDMLGVPVIPVSARKRTGLDILMDSIAGYKDKYNGRKAGYHQSVIYSAEIEDKIEEKYDFIEKVLEEVIIKRSEKTAFTDRIDSVLTNRYLGLPIFLLIMGIVFFLTFAIGDMIKGVFEGGLELFSERVANYLDRMNVRIVLSSLIVDGIIAGVGGILTFLPNIFILFLALAFLEDSGYMARVAYIMDGIMGKVGLSGKAFIPMLLGFGCTVPAIMASRSLGNMQDRRKTILVTPFMSCSARLPIYVLFSKMFFGKKAMPVAYSMYLIGITVAIVVAYVMDQNTIVKKTNSLLIELPQYKSPNARTIIIYVWEKIKEYLTKAGTTIFVASVIIWFILNFGPGGMVSDMSKSFGALIGKTIAPVLKPAGLGMWQVVVALISGIAAKEVVVSSFGILFSISNINSAEGMAGLSLLLSGLGFGAANAYALMVFCLLYIPCAATIGVVQREMRSWKWTIFMVFFQLIVATFLSILAYQIARLFM